MKVAKPSAAIGAWWTCQMLQTHPALSDGGFRFGVQGLGFRAQTIR